MPPTVDMGIPGAGGDWVASAAHQTDKRVLLADDTTPADIAYRQANEGTALLWRCDFQNARHLLDAMARRADHVPARRRRKGRPDEAADVAAAATATTAAAPSPNSAPPTRPAISGFRAGKVSEHNSTESSTATSSGAPRKHPPCARHG